MKLVDLNSKPHGGKSHRDLIYCSSSAHFYPPHQDPTITNFFALEGSMDPLTVKFIGVINQMKNNEVYTEQKLWSI